MRPRPLVMSDAAEPLEFEGYPGMGAGEDGHVGILLDRKTRQSARVSGEVDAYLDARGGCCGFGSLLLVDRGVAVIAEDFLERGDDLALGDVGTRALEQRGIRLRSGPRRPP